MFCSAKASISLHVKRWQHVVNEATLFPLPTIIGSIVRILRARGKFSPKLIFFPQWEWISPQSSLQVETHRTQWHAIVSAPDKRPIGPWKAALLSSDDWDGAGQCSAGHTPLWCHLLCRWFDGHPDQDNPARGQWRTQGMHPDMGHVAPLSQRCPTSMPNALWGCSWGLKGNQICKPVCAFFKQADHSIKSLIV